MDDTATRTPLRVWPGVAIAILLCAIRFGLPIVAPGQMPYAVLSGVAGAFLIVLWWLFFSRAPWVERLGAVVLMVAGVYATRAFVDVSISHGAMGFLFFCLA